jgi:putative transcriptional regulator
MDNHIGKGTYLIANPHGTDQNFMKTVVLICDHNKNGTFGLILNKTINLAEAHSITTETHLPDIKEYFFGGPVDTSKLFCLHGSKMNHVCSCGKICDGVHLLSSQDCLDSLLAEKNSETPFRLYLGCACWSPGQLEDEIKMNFWSTGPANHNIVFYPNPDKIWWYILRFISNYDPESPFNPSLPVLN